MRALTEERGLWRWAAVALGIVSFCKGIRFPNRWSATQAMVNYDLGLTKRGLFGATLGKWLGLGQYGRFLLVSVVLILALMGMLVLFTRRSGAMRRLGAGAVVAVFFASYAVTFLAHLVGYLDIPLAILTVALLLVRDVRVRLAAAVPVCVIALLIHEMFFFVFLPVLLFSFLVDAAQMEDVRRRRGIWVGAALVAMLSAGVTVRLARERPLTMEQMQAMRASIIARANFPVREDFFYVLVRSSADNTAMVTQQELHNPVWQMSFVASAATFALPIAMLVAALLWTVRARGGRWKPMLAAALVAGFSPGLMYLVGYDCARWDALICLDCFLVVLIAARAAPEQVPGFSVAYRNAAVLVIALSMASGEVLMDGASVKSFPFLTNVVDTVHLVRHQGWAAPAQ